MAAGSGTTTTPRRFLLLLVSAVVVMILSWTAPATLQLPVIVMTTAAQPGVIYTIRSNNVRNPTNSAFLRRNLLPWAQRNLPVVSDFIRKTILCGKTQEHTEVILQFEDNLFDAAKKYDKRAYVLDNTIYVSVGFIVDFRWFKDEAERVSFFQRAVYHEMTHVWQFLTGYTRVQDETRGLVEGIADYAAAKGHGADFLNTADCQPTAADDWYRGYCRTAKFLLYLEQEGYGQVVCNANLMLKYGPYDEQYFTTLLKNTPPKVLWRDFLNSLVNPPPPFLVDGHGNRTDDVGAGAAAATATY